MPTVAWNENSPADGDNAGQGDDAIRSLKSSIRVGLDGEHVWPSGGGDAGVHRLGSARAYVGTQSIVSSAGTDGRLMVTSDTSRLFHVGSAGTSYVGGQNVIEGPGQPTGGTRFYWAQEVGSATLVSGTTTISFPRSGFSSTPTVILSENPNFGSPLVVAMLNGVTGTQFGVLGHRTDTGALASFDFNWLAIGPRTF
jgi:hypothetical protein